MAHGRVSNRARPRNSCIFDTRVENRGIGWAPCVVAGPARANRRMDLGGSPARMSSLTKLTLALAAALLVTGPVALAAEETPRGKYVATGEPICKANTEAQSRIL